MGTVVEKADPINPRLNQAFVEYAQARGFLVDPARVRKPTDKALSSHCTSWVVSDRLPFVAVLAPQWAAGCLPGDDVRDYVIMLTLFVQWLALEPSFVVPLLDGGGAHTEACGRLGEVQEALGLETLLAAGKAVLYPDVVHDPEVKGLLCAGSKAHLVQFFGYSRFGVILEERVDGADDIAAGAPRLGGGELDRDLQGGSLAGLEADLSPYAVPVARQGHVIDQEPGHALTLSLRGARVAPQGTEVRSQRQHPGLIGFGQWDGFCALALVIFLGSAEGPQGFVPVRFQAGGDQPVVGIDRQVTAPG